MKLKHCREKKMSLRISKNVATTKLHYKNILTSQKMTTCSPISKIGKLPKEKFLNLFA